MNERTRSLTALALIAALTVALFALLPHDIPEKSRVARWSDAAATDYLSGHLAEDLKTAWGMPDGMFSGLFGEWWYEGDTQITVFYQNSPEAPEPVIREVSVQPREAPKN